MVDAGSRPLSLYLRHRFHPAIMKIESGVVSAMSFLFFKGDQVTWAQRLFMAYKMWEQGAEPKEIAERIGVPLLIARNWSEIWDSYYVAFTTGEYGG
jgi:hypothetical protein